MAYQVLARKWRPRRFSELVGQEHVVTALSNAIQRGRLHHAYLLTGTRGVGKTTIARILAKSLNCVQGVTATPCGICPACTDIDSGRFVDLLELDAASNTGIDNMREILDNARYAPTVGRYKVYLIDEVHMLSKPAFNSMLKTLEEPPEHVKFVLATTDPQKIPVTVLSRCLQFNLKPLLQPVIAARLGDILRAEGIGFDDAAVSLIARAAQGSMRDALSVLDQAIAYGAGEVREAVVRTMLGVIDTEYTWRIIDSLVASDGPALLKEGSAVVERGLSLPSALEELATLFHRIAVAQIVPVAVEAFPDAQQIARYANALTPESVQLSYQICVQGRDDLPLAPDEATGFTMTLLRLLAFEPGATIESRSANDVRPVQIPPASEARANAPAQRTAPEAEPRSESAGTTSTRVELLAIEDWPSFVAGLGLTGIALQLASQTELKRIDGSELVLAISEASRHLTERGYVDKLRAALEQALGRRVRLRFEIGAMVSSTLAAQEKRDRTEAQARTEATFRSDPFVQDVLTRFGATIRPDSIKPL